MNNREQPIEHVIPYHVCINCGSVYGSVSWMHSKCQHEYPEPIPMNHSSWEEFIELLERKHMVRNGGRGVSCVDTICTYLKMKDPWKAQACVENEWDKISSYPNIARLLNTEFNVPYL